MGLLSKFSFFWISKVFQISGTATVNMNKISSDICKIEVIMIYYVVWYHFDNCQLPICRNTYCGHISFCIWNVVAYKLNSFQISVIHWSKKIMIITITYVYYTTTKLYYYYFYVFLLNQTLLLLFSLNSSAWFFPLFLCGPSQAKSLRSHTTRHKTFAIDIKKQT